MELQKAAPPIISHKFSVEQLCDGNFLINALDGLGKHGSHGQILNLVAADAALNGVGVQEGELGDDAVVQASRNMLLGFRDSLIAELNGIVQAETAKAYSKDLLKTLVPETVKAWSKNAEASELSVLLSEKDCKELEDELKSALKAEIAKGLEVKADKSLAAGFRIGVNNGAAYYDYSAESVAELFSAYLNPRVAALMKEAAKGTN